VNSLPEGDPLRAVATAPQLAKDDEPVRAASSAVAETLPDKILAKFRADGGTTSTIEVGEARPAEPPRIVPVVQSRPKGGVVVDASRRVAVPSFDGAALRTVVEEAANLGLRVQPVGSGLARQQVPAAGTMVPSGTEVVVRFAR
jgi:cell division protein FtsI (penicillin-binding protein 3)